MRATTAQKDPSEKLIEKLARYIMHVWFLQKQFCFKDSSLIVMDETSVWNDMVSFITVKQAGAKHAALKKTEHENVQVSVCLTVKGGRTKLKLFIVFAGAEQEYKISHKEFKSRWSVASSTNGWMNEDLTMRWVNKNIGRFAFSNRLLTWDSYETYLTDPQENFLKEVILKVLS